MFTSPGRFNSGIAHDRCHRTGIEWRPRHGTDCADHEHCPDCETIVSIESDRKKAELVGLGQARQSLYVFLSAALSEPPSATTLDSLRGDAFLNPATDLLGSEALVPLRQFNHPGADIDDPQRCARQEFINLFKVPGSQYVTPYESVSPGTQQVGGRQTRGRLMGQSAVDVQHWYRLAAVELSDEYKDLPDHICLELDFLAHLCVKEQEFASAGDGAKLTRAWEIQRDFLAAHVVPWIGDLRGKIYEKSQHQYFRAVADIAVEITRRDLTTLEGVVGRSKGHPVPVYDGIEP